MNMSNVGETAPEASAGSNNAGAPPSIRECKQAYVTGMHAMPASIRPSPTAPRQASSIVPVQGAGVAPMAAFGGGTETTMHVQHPLPYASSVLARYLKPVGTPHHAQLTTVAQLAHRINALPEVATAQDLAAMLDEHVLRCLGRPDGEGGTGPRRLLILGEQPYITPALIQALLGVSGSGEKVLLLMEGTPGAALEMKRAAPRYWALHLQDRSEANKRLSKKIADGEALGYLTALGAFVAARRIELCWFPPLDVTGDNIAVREHTVRQFIADALDRSNGRLVVTLCSSLRAGQIHEHFTRDKSGSGTRVAAAVLAPPPNEAAKLAACLPDALERLSYAFSHPDVLAWRPAQALIGAPLDVDELLASRGIKL